VFHSNNEQVNIMPLLIRFNEYFFTRILLTFAFVSMGGAFPADVMAQLQVDPIQKRLNEVCDFLSTGKLEYATILSADFRSKVTEEQLQSVVQAIGTQCGACTGIKITSKISEFAVKANATTKNNFVIPITLSV